MHNAIVPTILFSNLLSSVKMITNERAETIIGRAKYLGVAFQVDRKNAANKIVAKIGTTIATGSRNSGAF